ncbi:MAG: hypothetical protein WBB48_01205 [Thermodesulfobacteriota bacterium]
MKLNEIWKKIGNEHQYIQDMVLGSLNGQLKICFDRIIALEIYKLGIVHEDIKSGFVSYHDLKYLSEESWQDLGFDMEPILSSYRKLVLVVDEIRVIPENEFFNPKDDIDLGVEFKKGIKPNIDMGLLKKIIDQVYESEFIDIEDSTLLNLKDNRKLYIITFS